MLMNVYAKRLLIKGICVTTHIVIAPSMKRANELLGFPKDDDPSKFLCLNRFQENVHQTQQTMKG